MEIITILRYKPLLQQATRLSHLIPALTRINRNWLREGMVTDPGRRLFVARFLGKL